MFVIEGIASPAVLLDANAVRYCFNPKPPHLSRGKFTDAQLEELRRTLLALARGKLIRGFITEPVGWELTAVYVEEGAERYGELLEFYLAFGSGRRMKNEYDRKVLELTFRRRLTDTEAFRSYDPAKRLAEQLDPEYIARIHAMQRAHKDTERAQEAARRTTLVPLLDAKVPTWKTGFLQEAANDWTAVIRHYTSVEMRAQAPKLQGLRMRPGTWPRPEDTPSFWYGESFYIAKFLSVFVDTQKQLTSKSSVDAMPDMLDATHFRDAAYADVLVTQDEDFRKVAARAKTSLKIVSFDDFATLVLAAAPSLGGS